MSTMYSTYVLQFCKTTATCCKITVTCCKTNGRCWQTTARCCKTTVTNQRTNLPEWNQFWLVKDGWLTVQYNYHIAVADTHSTLLCMFVEHNNLQLAYHCPVTVTSQHPFNRTPTSLMCGELNTVLPESNHPFFNGWYSQDVRDVLQVNE